MKRRQQTNVPVSREMTSPVNYYKGSASLRGQGVGFAASTKETRYQPPVAQVLPNNNQLDGDLVDDQFDQSDPVRLGGSPNIIDIGGGPATKERLSPRGRSGDGREDVVAFHDGPHGDGPKILNHGAEDQFEALDLEYTLNQTDFIPNATLMEVKDPRIPAGKEDPIQHSPIPVHHSQSAYQPRKSPVHLRRHPQYSTAYDATQRTQPFQSNLHDYPQYSDYPALDPVARTTGYPVPHHTKMNLSQWQHNLDSQLKLQQQMQHLQLNPAGHPSSISGGGHSLHRHAVGAAYTLGDPNVGLGVVSTDTTNMEGLIRAKENMLHERNIIIERQKLEIAHLQKQNEEQEAIARQRMFARSREDGDMLFLKMQEYQYEIASLKAQLAEVSTARIAEGDQLNRKLGEVEYEMRQAQEAMKASQHTNEKTITDLKKQLRHRESEVESSRAQAETSKRDYDKLKKKIGKMERYMHDLPTADEYRESTETIRSLHQKEAVMEERVVSLESALTKAKQKALKSKMEASSLEEQKNELQLQIERMKREMGKLQSALGSKETGDPTDLELCSRDQLVQLREENEKHSSSVEHLKKVIESKHKHLQKVKGEHQRALQEAESRLLQEEGVITALRLELKDKEHSMEEMSRSMKELASQSQELYDHNLSLQESVRTLELKASSDKARLTGQLVKELTRCVQDLQQLVELCSQRAEGQEPNVSLLLGFRPSSAMSYEPGDDDDTPTSETVIKARLSQVQKLREDIDLLRSLISDKYAEDVGSNCITQ